MVRLDRILLVFALIVSYVRGGVKSEPDQTEPMQDEFDGRRELTRGQRHHTRRGFLDGRFPVQRYRMKSNRGYYRQQGKGGGQGKWGKKGKSKRSKRGRDYGYGYDDGRHNGYLDDDGVLGYNGYDRSFCLPHPGSYSHSYSHSHSHRHSHSHSHSSSSDSWDYHRDRERQLRGTDRVLKGKSKRHWGRGKGGGKGGGYQGHGPQDYYGNGFGYGFEYGPEGLLRPRCPPGYVYYDQLPDADHPIRPQSARSSLSSEDSPPTQAPITPRPTEVGPDTPDTTQPATPIPGPTAAPEGPVETPAPETPGPATSAPETPAPETPAPETPAPETPAPSPGTAPEGNRVVVDDSFLEYGFFGGTTVREPNQEELDGLYEQTNRFFNDVFAAMYGADFAAFTAENNVMTYNGPDADYPVTIDFNAAVEFVEGVTSPTRDEVFAAMQNSDLNNYIQSYVWSATPPMTGLFYDTQRVRYDARIQGSG